jgi:hypothetical protein
MTGVFPFREEAGTAARANPLAAPKLTSQPISNGPESATALHATDWEPWLFPAADLEDHRALAMLARLSR